MFGIALVVLGIYGISRMALEIHQDITSRYMGMFALGGWLIYYQIRKGYIETCVKCHGAGVIESSQGHNDIN